MTATTLAPLERGTNSISGPSQFDFVFRDFRKKSQRVTALLRRCHGFAE